MILVYKYVRDSIGPRDPESNEGARLPAAGAWKLVGDLPDEDALVGFGEGEYAIRNAPNPEKFDRRREVYPTASGLKVRKPK